MTRKEYEEATSTKDWELEDFINLRDFEALTEKTEKTKNTNKAKKEEYEYK